MRSFPYLVCLNACFVLSLAQAAGDDDDTPNQNSTATVQTGGDSAPIEVSMKSQRMAGIKTQVLEAVRQKPEFTAYGAVLNPEPLLQLRQQYLAASAQQDSARARYTEAHLNLSRTRDLHNQDIVSTRRLQEQQALWQSDKAALAASNYQSNSILASSRLEWGEILTDWFVLMRNDSIKPFLNQHARLLRITLPANRHLNADIRHIHVDERGQRQTAIKAELIDASPKIDPISLGERYFFKLEGRTLPFGSHITAWISEDARQISGVKIPKSALVWHLGQPIVFVKIDDDHFGRFILREFLTDDQGYFVTEAVLRPGLEIVVTGAQSILSQQLKSMIPREDKD